MIAAATLRIGTEQGRVLQYQAYHTNTFGFHTSHHSKTTVPLEKIQDVQLEETWLHTLFGVKKVNVETAGINNTANGTASPEISAAFLKQPEQVREAIALAARLNREAMGAPGQARMHRNAGVLMMGDGGR